jgi:hypothetical protein
MISRKMNERRCSDPSLPSLAGIGPVAALLGREGFKVLIT